MTVKDLINDLKSYNENMVVVFQAENSMYADYIGTTRRKELRSFYGPDKDVIVLISDGQAGAV